MLRPMLLLLVTPLPCIFRAALREDPQQETQRIFAARRCLVRGTLELLESA